MKKSFLFLGVVTSLFLLLMCVSSAWMIHAKLRDQKIAYTDWVSQSLRDDLARKTAYVFSFIDQSLTHEKGLLSKEGDPDNNKEAFENSLAQLVPAVESVNFFRTENEVDAYVNSRKGFYAEAVLVHDAFVKTVFPVISGDEANRHVSFARLLKDGDRNLGVAVFTFDSKFFDFQQITLKADSYIEVYQDQKTIYSVGDASIKKGDAEKNYVIDGTGYSVGYWVSMPDAWRDFVSEFIVALVLMGGMLCAVFLTFKRLHNSLKNDMSQLFVSIKSIFDKKRHKTPSLDFPETYSLYVSLIQIYKLSGEDNLNDSY